MKKALWLSTVALLFGFGSGYLYAINKLNGDWATRYRSVYETIPMDDFFRKPTGYDSIEIYGNMKGDKLEVNFCCPNQWAFEKFKK